MGKGAPPLPEMFSRDQLFKPFLVMGIMYVVKQYVDAENEDHIQMIRIAFGVQLVGCFLIHLVIGPMIAKQEDGESKDNKMVTVVTKENPMSSDETKTQMTAKEYDTKQNSEAMRKLVMSAAITGFIHFQMAIIFPLAIQAVLGPINMYGTPIFQVYFLNQPATGKLKRPWEGKGADPFSQYKAMMKHIKNDGKPAKMSGKERRGNNKQRARGK